MTTKTKSQKIGVLGATLETPNLGVSTLATGAVACILHAFPEANVFFLDFERESTQRTLSFRSFSVTVPLVNMRFSKRFWLSNNIAVLMSLAILFRLIPVKAVRNWIIKSNQCLSEIYSGDLYAALSGGDSFSDIYGLGRFIYETLPQILVILLKKRLILLPQTYGPFKKKSTRSIAKWIIAHAERCWCRDLSSLAQVMGASASDRQWREQTFCYDLGFAIDPISPPAIYIEGLPVPNQRNPRLIGLNISGLLFQGGYTGKNEFGIQCNYKILVHNIIQSFLAQEGTSILLVPHVFGSPTEGESDTLACEQVFAALQDQYSGKLGILRNTYSPGEMRYIVGLCSFFVGSRMHACIAATAQSVPAISIAYSDKFLGVMRTVGVDALTADARKLSSEDILSIIQEAWLYREKISTQLQQSIPEIQITTLNILNSLQAASET